MVIDTSALVAIIKREPDSASLIQKINEAERLYMSAGTMLELTLVLGHSNQGVGDLLIKKLGVRVVEFDAEQLSCAQEAFYRYGKRSSSLAKLNFGDCMSYAAAKTLGEPLLFKGEDFIHTDIAQA